MEIITQTIDGIVDRAQMTNAYVKNEKRKNTLDKAAEHSEKLRDNIDNTVLLEELIQEILHLKRIKTKDNKGFFSKSSTLDLMNKCVEEFRKDKKNLIDKLDKELLNVPLMNKDLYYAACHSVGDRDYNIITRAGYKRDTSKSSFDQVKDIIFWNDSWRMQKISTHRNRLPESYKVFIGNKRDEFGRVMKDDKSNPIPEYRLFNNILDAANFYQERTRKKEVEKVIDKIEEKTLEELNKGLSEQHYKTIKDYIVSKKNNIEIYAYEFNNQELEQIKKIVDKLNEMGKDISMYRVSIIKFNIIKEVLEHEHGLYADKNRREIIGKMKQEISAFATAQRELIIEQNKLKEELEKLLKKLRAEKVERNKRIEKITSKESASSVSQELEEKNNIESYAYKEELKVEKKPQEVINEKTSNDNETLSPEEQENNSIYSNYVRLRDNLDTVYQNKNTYRDFEKEVAIVGEAATYDEVLRDMSFLRETLPFAEDLKNIIEVIKENNPDANFNSIESNGLSSLENRIREGLDEYLKTNKNISPILKEEIEYYIDRIDTMKSQVNLGFQMCGREATTAYKEILNEHRLLYLSNTILLNQISLEKTEGSKDK